MTPGSAVAGAEPSWTIDHILRWTHEYFAKRNLASPRLDAEVLLAHALGVDRVHLYTHYDQPLGVEERGAFRTLVRRRASGEPVAYIRGHKEFYGRSFAVTPAVLVPRPETEHLVEAVLTWVKSRALSAPRILDIGTGSGALALTFAAELPAACVWASDICAAALEVAQANAQALEVEARVSFAQGDLFAPIAARPAFDVIVSNPPYIDRAARATLPPDVRDFEPAAALFAEDRGLAVIARLIQGAPDRLARPGLLVCEMGAEQEAAVRSLAQKAGFSSFEVLRDLQGHPRALVAERSC